MVHYKHIDTSAGSLLSICNSNLYLTVVANVKSTHLAILTDPGSLNPAPHKACGSQEYWWATVFGGLGQRHIGHNSAAPSRAVATNWADAESCGERLDG